MLLFARSVCAILLSVGDSRTLGTVVARQVIVSVSVSRRKDNLVKWYLPLLISNYTMKIVIRFTESFSKTSYAMKT